MLGNIALVLLAAYLSASLFRFLWGYSVILVSLLHLCVVPSKGEEALPGDSLHHTATDGIALLGFIGVACTGIGLAIFTADGVTTMFAVLGGLGLLLAAEMLLAWPLSFVAWWLCRKVGSIPQEIAWRDFARSLKEMIRGWGWRGSR